MKAFEIYKAVDPALVSEMLLYFREEDRNMYKTSLATLATNRKLRPAFVQKKSVADQIAWMHNALMFKPNANIGEHLLQVWFMKAKSEVLVLACDRLEIPHNGEGYVEGELPKELDTDKVKSAVDALLEQFGAPLTTLYLYVFNLQLPGGWDNLADMLKSDERLVFQG